MINTSVCEGALLASFRRITWGLYELPGQPGILAVFQQDWVLIGKRSAATHVDLKLELCVLFCFHTMKISSGCTSRHNKRIIRVGNAIISIRNV